jgi:hypothetical protein
MDTKKLAQKIANRDYGGRYKNPKFSSGNRKKP